MARDLHVHWREPEWSFVGQWTMCGCRKAHDMKSGECPDLMVHIWLLLCLILLAPSAVGSSVSLYNRIPGISPQNYFLASTSEANEFVCMSLRRSDKWQTDSVSAGSGLSFASVKYFWVISSFSLPEWKRITVHGKREAGHLHDWDAFHPLLGRPPVDIFMLNWRLKSLTEN